MRKTRRTAGSLAGDGFVVRYTLTGPSAVPAGPGDEPGTPDYVNQVLYWAERAQEEDALEALGDDRALVRAFGLDDDTLLTGSSASGLKGRWWERSGPMPPPWVLQTRRSSALRWPGNIASRNR